MIFDMFNLFPIWFHSNKLLTGARKIKFVNVTYMGYWVRNYQYNKAYVTQGYESAASRMLFWALVSKGKLGRTINDCSIKEFSTAPFSSSLPSIPLSLIKLILSPFPPSPVPLPSPIHQSPSLPLILHPPSCSPILHPPSRPPISSRPLPSPQISYALPSLLLYLLPFPLRSKLDPCSIHGI